MYFPCVMDINPLDQRKDCGRILKKKNAKVYLIIPRSCKYLGRIFADMIKNLADSGNTGEEELSETFALLALTDGNATDYTETETEFDYYDEWHDKKITGDL